MLKEGEWVVVNVGGNDDGNCGEEDTGNWAGLEEMNGGRGEGSEGEEEDKEEEGGTAGLIAVKMLGVTEAKGEVVTLGVNKKGRGDENGELTAGTLEGVSLRGVKGVVTNARGEVKVPGREVKVPRVPGVVKVSGGRWVVITGWPRKPGVAVDTWGRGSGVGRGVMKLKGGGVGVKRGLSCGRRGTSSNTPTCSSSSSSVLIPSRVSLGGVLVPLRCGVSLFLLFCPRRLLGKRFGLLVGL